MCVRGRQSPERTFLYAASARWSRGRLGEPRKRCIGYQYAARLNLVAVLAYHVCRGHGQVGVLFVRDALSGHRNVGTHVEQSCALKSGG